MGEPLNKRKKPNYYMKKKRKQYILEPGLRGFLCTCNFREKECIREAYNLLNQYADRIKSKTVEANEDTSVESKNASDNSDSDDIADELSKEIDDYKKKSTTKRFQVVESGAKNILFIRTTVEDPTEIVSVIINDILTSKQQKSRFLLRLLPIEMICKANMTEIKQSVLTLIEKHFLGEPKTFSVAFNHRNNHQILREDILKEIPALVSEKNSKHKVDLTNPDLTIIIEVIRGMCLLNIIPFYNKYKKYNLIQLFESVAESSKTDEKDASTAKTEDNNDKC